MSPEVQLLTFGISFTVVLYGGYWIYLRRHLTKLQAQRAARKAK